MRNILLLTACLLLAISGCASVKVEGSEKPIKVDVSMRLDIYQHVVKDIDAIENIVTKPNMPEQKGMLISLIGNAYAQESLSYDVEQAAYRRQARYSEINSLLANGVIGENRRGFIEIRNAAEATASTNTLVSTENSDRSFIYKSIADKNKVPVAEVEKIYAEKLQNNAPQGAPVETLDLKTGNYQWQLKR